MERTKPHRVGSILVLILALVALGTLSLILVLLLGGSSPQPSRGPLPDAGPVVAWARAVLPLLTTIAASTTIGFSLIGGGYLVSGRDAERLRAMRIAASVAGVWGALVLIAIGLAVTEIRVESAQLASQGVGAMLGSDQVRPLLIELALVAVTGVVALRLRLAWLALPLGVAALMPTIFLVGHARTANSALLAGGAKAIHVAAATIWVGGLLAMGWMALNHHEIWRVVIPRYSRVALACVIALVSSGLVAALVRISPGEVLTTAYGLVLLVKAVVLVGLGGLGAMQRRRVLAKDGPRQRQFVILTGSELTLMLLVFGLASGLAATSPPP